MFAQMDAQKDETFPRFHHLSRDLQLFAVLLPFADLCSMTGMMAICRSWRERLSNDDTWTSLLARDFVTFVRFRAFQLLKPMLDRVAKRWRCYCKLPRSTVRQISSYPTRLAKRFWLNLTLAISNARSWSSKR